MVKIFETTHLVFLLLGNTPKYQKQLSPVWAELVE